MSSFVIGEVDLSPPSRNKLVNLVKNVGARYLLLDSVRDQVFLSGGSNGVNGTQDYGLGVVDNGLFLFTSNTVPGSPRTPRRYPIKFFWLGSPLGTNDVNDTFSIYVADVDPTNFYPGAQASLWLVNPRLVVSVAQARTDVVGWFDANYPGGAAKGVGGSITASNSQYGSLHGAGSAVGDISGMNSIDGQVWPIYDYVDGSILLYFSVKTPNANTLSIYCYKLADSEVSSPAGFQQFLGGLNSAGWMSFNVPLSSHRFSIVSPDPLSTAGPVKGQQSAVMFYAFNTTAGLSYPDHGANCKTTVVYDVHGSPLNPGVFTSTNSGIGVGLDKYGFFPVDKLGSIHVSPATNNHVGGAYACLYNAPSESDRGRSGGKPTNGVTISGMQLRVMYYHPGTGSGGVGNTPVHSPEGTSIIGTCRPQFTTLPDGMPKIVYAGFAFDQSLSLNYEYVEHDILSPAKQEKIELGLDNWASLTFYSFGKRKLRIWGSYAYDIANADFTNPSQSHICTVWQLQYANAVTPVYGIYNEQSVGSFILGTMGPQYDTSGNIRLPKILDESIDDIGPIMLLNSPNSNGNTPNLFRYQFLVELT